MVDSSLPCHELSTINYQPPTKMARILSIDYGGKRTGLAVTDPLQIIATGLCTIESKELIPFLKKYFSEESVELIIIGLPKNWKKNFLPSHSKQSMNVILPKWQKAPCSKWA